MPGRAIFNMLKKPIFRWTFGPCHPAGYAVLEESMQQAVKLFGDFFDWRLCVNNLTHEQIDIVRTECIADLPITLFQQDVGCSPIPWETRRFKRGSSWSVGSFWKVCPARMSLDVHEIIVDNDIVLLRSFPELDHFLHSTDFVLLNEDQWLYHGNYTDLLPAGLQVNSGFIGLPPGYDFGKEIKSVWLRFGCRPIETNGDEQGLLGLVVTTTIHYKKIPWQVLPEYLDHHDGVEQILPLILENRRQSASGIHFTKVNRSTMHKGWQAYERLRNSKRTEYFTKLLDNTSAPKLFL